MPNTNLPQDFGAIEIQDLFTKSPNTEFGLDFFKDINSAPRVCECHFCKVIYPMMNRISSALSDDLRKEFDSFSSYYLHAADDANYWECVAKGDWFRDKKTFQSFIDGLQEKCDKLID